MLYLTYLYTLTNIVYELILSSTILTSLRSYSTNNSIDKTKEVIVGSLLGDADIELRGRAINGRFKIIQSTKHKDYFLMLFEIFSQYCSTLHLSNLPLVIDYILL